MSNHLAIATVTAALGALLRAAIKEVPGGADVSVERPNDLSTQNPGIGVNLFLYRVSPNSAYRNNDLPTRRIDSSLVQRPQAAMDLHYLLTFFGDESDLGPQRVLGKVVTVLHSRPVLTRQLIKDVIDNPHNHQYKIQGSDLDKQIELVKFAPLDLSLEDLSKLWSVFFQTPYRLSIAYLATLVLIEADETPHQALPVRRRKVYVMPYRQPAIERIATLEGDGESITLDSTLVIEGERLRGDVTRVRIGEVEIEPPADSITDSRIALDLNSAAVPKGSLRAGLLGVQVIHRVSMGAPPTEHSGVESNVTPTLLRPEIEKKKSTSGQPTGEFDIKLTPAVINTSGDVEEPAKLEVTLSPRVGKDQRAVLLLNEFKDKSPAGYSFAAESLAKDSDNVSFSLPRVDTGDYLVRVQVDGAQSLLEVDTDESSNTYNCYYRPRVQIS